MFRTKLVMGHYFYSYKQICTNVKMRANAFAALGSLSSYGVGAQREAFLEQVLLLRMICVKSFDVEELNYRMIDHYQKMIYDAIFFKLNIVSKQINVSRCKVCCFFSGACYFTTLGPAYSR